MKCCICGKHITNGLVDSKGNYYCSEECANMSLPKCCICGKPIRNGFTDKKGNHYCSEECADMSLPKCSICGKPVRNGLIDDKGICYCSQECYTKSLPTCYVCGKYMKNWFETNDGKKVCSEECADKLREKCCICGKPIRNGLTDDKGNCYCSQECYTKSLPTCYICGKHMENWLETNDGKKVCSEECADKLREKCCICGKPVRDGLIDNKGSYYCSQECYNKILPKCNYCSKPMKNWIETNNGEKYCNETCYNNHKNNKLKIEMKSPMSSKELAYITGLSNEECENFMKLNKIDGDEALELIDIFMESLNNNIVAPVEVTSCLYNAGIYIKLAERLSKYNTMRGGVKGYGGFIFEELHAADVASKGANITVLNDNGIADFIVKDANGKEILVQAKAGYKPNTIDWNKYKGQTIVVDKGNSALANEAKRAGLKVQESNIFKKEADLVARTQQLESKLTGRVTAPITGTMASAHYAGLASAKLAARIGVSMKIGENIYDIISGEKSFEEAAGNIVKDSVVLVGGAYIGGAALTITGTALGMTATAIAGTSIGAATIGTVGAATAAIGGTAVGGMIISGVGTVAAGTATIVSSIAAAPLLPVVTGFAVLGCAFKWFKSK